MQEPVRYTMCVGHCERMPLSATMDALGIGNNSHNSKYVHCALHMAFASITICFTMHAWCSSASWSQFSSVDMLNEPPITHDDLVFWGWCCKCVSVSYIFSFSVFYGTFQMNAVDLCNCWTNFSFSVWLTACKTVDKWEMLPKSFYSEESKWIDPQMSAIHSVCSLRIIPLPQPKTKWHKRYDKSQNKC